MLTGLSIFVVVAMALGAVLLIVARARRRLVARPDYQMEFLALPIFCTLVPFISVFPLLPLPSQNTAEMLRFFALATGCVLVSLTVALKVSSRQAGAILKLIEAPGTYLRSEDSKPWHDLALAIRKALENKGTGSSGGSGGKDEFSRKMSKDDSEIPDLDDPSDWA